MHIFDTEIESSYKRQGLIKELLFTEGANKKFEEAIESNGEVDFSVDIEMDSKNKRLSMVPASTPKLTLLTDCIGITALQSAVVKIYPVSTDLMFIEVISGCILLKDKEVEGQVFPLDLSGNVAGKKILLNEIKWITAKDFMRTFDMKLSERWGLGEGKFRYDYSYTVVFEMNVTRISGQENISFTSKLLDEAVDLTGGEIEKIVRMEYTQKSMKLMERNRETTSTKALESEEEEIYEEQEEQEYDENNVQWEYL